MKRKTKIEEDLLKIGLFILLDGLVLHEVLSATQRGINSLRLAPSSGMIDFLKLEWEKIMKINYEPVFELANSVCQSFPTSPETDRILKRLIETVLDVLSSGVLLKHDLMGRIYHKLLLKTTGKYYATYYTSIPAAWILSNLVIKTPNPDLDWDFDKLENIKKFRVLDPACGSGTLISGIYMALKDKYILDRYKSNDPEALDLGAYHKIMLENVLSGWDILDFAGHLSLTSLALHNPKATFNHSNIYTLPVGPVELRHKGKGIYLGSLDYLEHLGKQRTFMAKDFVTHPKKKEMGVEREKPIEIPENSIDLVIMNPPFSRSAQPNIKFGYEEKKIMNLMNKRLRELGIISGYSGIGQAGLDAYFAILANKLSKPGGRIALVLKRSILSGVCWTKVRKEMLLGEYEIEYIVSNYDPGDKDLGIEPWNWSENTNLGEVLIIARKTNNPIERRYTTFINLWNKPKNEIESLKIVSDSIKARQKQGLRFLEGEGYEVLNLNKQAGIVYNVSQKHLENGFLMPCLFAYPDLNKWVFDLINNNLVPLVSLEKIVDKVGMDIKQIEQNFKLVSHQTLFPILWGHPGSLNTIYLKNYQYASPKKKGSDIIYDRGKGNLLIAERIWASTSNILILFSHKPILATEFWEVSMKNKDDVKILGLWGNSTFGFLLLLASSTSHRGDRFTLKKEQLLRFPVIDTSFFSKKNKQTLVDLFDRVKNIPFEPFPREFKLASIGKGVRKQIDSEFIRILNLKIDLKPYYELLSKEPVISLERL